MIYLDACAIVSMISGEPDAEEYAKALESDPARFTSMFAVWEAVLVLARPEKLGGALADVQRLVLGWLSLRDVALAGGAEAESLLGFAFEAAGRFGVSRRALSSFDCFHYAYAKSAGAPILTKDEALRATDVERLP